MDGGVVMVEGPGWWRERVIRSGNVQIEGKDFQAEPWDPALAIGLRLKSTWIRVLGFPLKLWEKVEFEKLVDEFGVLLEIDPATRDLTSFKEAKIRVGVTDQGKIPVSKDVVFRNDRGEWCWTPVRFVIEQPGGNKIGGAKKKRTWVRKKDPSGEGSSQHPKRHREEDTQEDEGDDDFDWEGEDLMEQERQAGKADDAEEEVEEIEMIEMSDLTTLN